MAALNKLQVNGAQPRAPQRTFGELGIDPDWKRGEVIAAPEGTRLAVMACCGFAFDAVHEDEGGGYTCPDCKPAAAPSVEPQALSDDLRQAQMHVDHAFELLTDDSGGGLRPRESLLDAEAISDAAEALAHAANHLARLRGRGAPSPAG